MIIVFASQFHIYSPCLGACLAQYLNSVINVKALVGLLCDCENLGIRALFATQYILSFQVAGRRHCFAEEFLASSHLLSLTAGAGEPQGRSSYNISNLIGGHGQKAAKYGDSIIGNSARQELASKGRRQFNQKHCDFCHLSFVCKQLIEDRQWRRLHFSQAEHDNDQFLFPQFSQKLEGESQTLAEEKLSTFLKTSKPKVNFIYMSFDCVLNHLLLSKHPPQCNLELTSSFILFVFACIV